MSIQKVVDRLDFCKSAGANKWMARCPAHDDRGPSLSLTEKPHKVTGELTPLIYCHAGCSSEDVLAAVGLGWEDVLPEKLEHNPATRYHAPRETVDSLVIELAEHDREQGKRLSKADIERYREAKKRMKGKAMPEPASAAEIKREAWTDEKQAAMEKTVLDKLESGEPLTASETTWGRWQLEHGVGS